MLKYAKDTEVDEIIKDLLNACAEIAQVFRENTVSKLESSNFFGDVQLQLDVEADHIIEKVTVCLFSTCRTTLMLVGSPVKKDLSILSSATGITLSLLILWMEAPLSTPTSRLVASFVFGRKLSSIFWAKKAQMLSLL